MGEDLSVGIKIGITAVMIVAILYIVVATTFLARRFAGRYLDDLATRSDPNYEATIKDLALERKPVPAPSIYVALSNYGEESLAQFDTDINGVFAENDNLEHLLTYSDKQLYMRVVQAADGLHVWVGDYEIIDEGWVKIP